MDLETALIILDLPFHLWMHSKNQDLDYVPLLG